jgi:plastocyanin
MRRVAYLATFSFIALLMLVPTGGAQERQVVKVAIRDFYFEPSKLIIEPGTTVQWVNESDTQHTVFATNPAGAFLSGTLNPGESFTHTFPERLPRPSPDSTARPGTYRYYCEVHPDAMRASVILSESRQEATTQVPEDTTTQQPPAVPSTGGINAVLLSGLLVVVAAVVVAVSVLGSAIRRRFL